MVSSKLKLRCFTLIELLIVVAIVAILAAIAVVNFQEAQERALRASDAANMKTIGVALQMYKTDFNRLPPADREAGPFMSHYTSVFAVGNGPAGGGSWDGVPWLLIERGYINDWKVLFCPKYLKLYRNVGTVGGTEYPRYHNFRYAYNSSGLSTGGALGGAGNVESGTVWILRDLWVPPDKGWYGGDYPDYPADFRFPWGTGDEEDNVEHVMGADMSVRLVIGGTEEIPEVTK